MHTTLQVTRSTLRAGGDGVKLVDFVFTPSPTIGPYVNDGVSS
jgi:hypothetical protein